MRAEIISIGDELLIGQTINTNGSWMGEQLNLIGITSYQITTITDSEDHILSTLKEASERAQIILMTGGLGPTKDDITKSTLCKYFNTKLEMKSEVLEKITKYFEGKGLEMLPVNEAQAMLPANCMVLDNSRGTASGMWFEQEGIIYVSMPGVPFEMKGIMKEQVLPRLSERFVDQAVVHRTVRTIGIGESYLAELIAEWEESLSEINIKLAYLPSPGIVKLRLSSVGKDKSRLIENIDTKVAELQGIIPQYIYGFEKDEINEVVANLLMGSGQTLATAESCTGGYIAHLITSVPGSSEFFKGSVISYANEVKQQELNVLESDLIEFGAVSKSVVEQMAKGVLNRMKTTYAVATSGIAGPGGGTEEKPVGTVWIAVATKDTVISKKFSFGKNRSRNIKVSALFALNMLRDLINA